MLKNQGGAGVCGSTSCTVSGARPLKCTPGWRGWLGDFPNIECRDEMQHGKWHGVNVSIGMRRLFAAVHNRVK
jgi:hypothetical protein